MPHHLNKGGSHVFCGTCNTCKAVSEYRNELLNKPMTTMRERFDELVKKLGLREETGSGFDEQACAWNFIQQELKKEREEIVEMIEELAEPYDGAKWLNQVNPETIINIIKKRV